MAAAAAAAAAATAITSLWGRRCLWRAVGAIPSATGGATGSVAIPDLAPSLLVRSALHWRTMAASHLPTPPSCRFSVLLWVPLVSEHLSTLTNWFLFQLRLLLIQPNGQLLIYFTTRHAFPVLQQKQAQQFLTLMWLKLLFGMKSNCTSWEIKWKHTKQYKVNFNEIKTWVTAFAFSSWGFFSRLLWAFLDFLINYFVSFVLFAQGRQFSPGLTIIYAICHRSHFQCLN